VFSEEELAFVETQRVAHLATVDAAGLPHVVPVCFAYVDGAFWIAVDEKPKTTTRLKRLRNIEANPQVALVFDRYDEDWSRLGYVMVRGTAEVLVAGEAHSIVLQELCSKYGQYGSMELEGRPLIRVAPERVVSWGDLGREWESSSAL
jgi:PPOX class probable F420-dependent enzyme